MAKFGNIVQAKAEMAMTNDQLIAAKAVAVQKILDKWDPSQWEGMQVSELRQKVKDLHKVIVKNEEIKYDAEKRKQAQEYDLKELNERQRQIARNKAKDQGLDPDDASSKYPPKKKIIARGERQVDRRNFKERRSVYDKKGAVPHFPNVATAETQMEKVIASYKTQEQLDEEEEEAGW